MNFKQAIATAKLGIAVRRNAWTIAKTMVFSAGGGTARAVLLIVESNVIHVARNTDLTQADRDSADWRVAA